MKTLGLIGGMSWESTVTYYRLINEAVRERCGGLRSARLVLYSVDFEQIEVLQHADRWDEAGEILAQAARALEAAGAELLVLCTNTMHKVADAIQAATSCPLLHIADATAAAIHAGGIHRVGLLGTRFTMEQDFYRARLEQRHAIDVRVPGPDDRETIHRIIYDELCRGVIRDESRARYRSVIARLVAQGAQAVILGCTEIGLLLGPDDADVPLLDTTVIHARAAVDAALN
jgi:aspartate racemase